MKFLKPKSALEVLVLEQQKQIQELQEQLNRNQLWLFQLAKKLGFNWKNNSWRKNV